MRISCHSGRSNLAVYAKISITSLSSTILHSVSAPLRMENIIRQVTTGLGRTSEGSLMKYRATFLTLYLLSIYWMNLGSSSRDKRSIMAVHYVLHSKMQITTPYGIKPMIYVGVILVLRRIPSSPVMAFLSSKTNRTLGKSAHIPSSRVCMASFPLP